MTNSSSKFNIGFVYCFIAYFVWGIIPIYWKALGSVGTLEILATRSIWSSVLVFLFILFTGYAAKPWEETKVIVSIKKLTALMTFEFSVNKSNWRFILVFCPRGYFVY